MRVVNMSLRFIIFALILLAGACSNKNATYFKKTGTSERDARVAWGECGGQFFPNGLIVPSTNAKILRCMKSKGFVTVRAYYEEKFIDWRKAPRYGNRIDYADEYLKAFDACGVRWNKEGACFGKHYIYSSEVDSISACLSKYDFYPTLPKTRGSVQILRSPDDYNAFFCTYKTPRK